MSIKERLKPYLKDTVIWKAVSFMKRCMIIARNYSCILGAFCLGWCSLDKLKGFIHEYGRREKITRLSKKGIDAAPKTYNGKRIINKEEANEVIGKAIEEGKPFMAGRYGSGELSAVWRVRDNGKGFIYPWHRALSGICSNAGFFPYDKNLMIKFADVMKEATYHVNLMAIWFNMMEEWMLRTYGNTPDYCRLHSIDPLTAPNPWSAKLKGRKVLIIHPFDKTIQAQYKKRELLFPGKNILPEFELRTVKAVQTIAGNRDKRFATWFDALEYMYNEAMKEDFDVAIIGCGAYGFPLAAKIKQAGKIAIHMGGVTQLLFGIKGRRWETEYKGDYPAMMNNPAWVRPSEEDRPKGFETIEGGCYW